MNEREIWSLRIAEAASDAELDSVDAALRSHPDSLVRVLRYTIPARRKALGSGAVAVDAPTQSAIPAVAVGYGIAHVDGRRLYQYRLTDEAFARLEADLSGAGSVAALAHGARPALFALWASEWFRRAFRGGGQRWAELVAALGMAEDQGVLRDLTARGLAAWGRPIIRSGDAREFLGSLAREGGFPAAAVEEGGRGWAQDVLKAIVAPLLAEPAAGEDRALELARAQRSRLPQLFGDDEFLALCADLALAIVQLRREAEAPAAAAGIPLLAWLELHRPGWQDRLPLATGGRAADALLDGLLSVQAITGGAVGVERLLVLREGCWREAARLTLDGAIDGAAMRTVDREAGRLRAFAAGEMARSLPGEIAMIDPPVDGEAHWALRSTRRARKDHEVPFSVPIDLDLRTGDQRVARIALPGGKPRRGALRVAVVDRGEDDAPTVLRVVGTGSGSYRAETLYVEIPAEWRIDATVGETADPVGRGEDGEILWRVTGGGFVSDPQGDRYRIRCVDVEETQSKLELIGTSVGWAAVRGDVDLFVGAPLVKPNKPGGALFIRTPGSRDWQPAPARLPIGHFELGWRDGRLLLDRRRVAVLPASATVRRTGSVRHPHYEIAGFADCAITLHPDAPLVADGHGGWRAKPGAQPVHRFEATLSWPDGPALTVTVGYPVPASLARWDGRLLADNERVALADLPKIVAVNEGRVLMLGELLDRGRRLADMTWEVVDELPMSSVATDLASLLLPTSIDAEVRIGMHDGIETWWRVRTFEVELSRNGDGVAASKGIVTPDALLVGRSLAEPAKEVVFGAYSLLTDANHRPAPMPPNMPGDWLLYLRAGSTILSRPLFYRGAIPASPATALARAMAQPHGIELDRALAAVLDAATRDDDDAKPIVAELLDLICSLRGLPPKTFLILDLLAGRPALLAKLALAAGPDQRDAVVALSDGLPFAWCMLPRDCWEAAKRQLFEGTLATLSPLGAEAPRFAMEAVTIAIARTIEAEPLLAPVLGEVTPDPLATVVMAFLNRGAVDRVARGDTQRYRRVLADMLPGQFLRFDERVLDTLDAPCAAALAVQGRWRPRADDVRHIKTVARSFPTYFADALAASLKEND